MLALEFWPKFKSKCNLSGRGNSCYLREGESNPRKNKLLHLPTWQTLIGLFKTNYNSYYCTILSLYIYQKQRNQNSHHISQLFLTTIIHRLVWVFARNQTVRLSHLRRFHYFFSSYFITSSLRSHFKGMEDFRRLAYLNGKQDKVNHNITQLTSAIDLHPLEAITRLNRMGLTRKGKKANVSKNATQLNTLKMQLEKEKQLQEKLKVEIANVEARFLGTEDVITVASLEQLKLLSLLKERGIYRGSKVICMPFENNQEKMKKVVAAFTNDFAVEILSQEACIAQFTAALMEVMKAIVPVPVPAPDIASTSGTSYDEDEDVEN